MENNQTGLTGHPLQDPKNVRLITHPNAGAESPIPTDASTSPVKTPAPAPEGAKIGPSVTQLLGTHLPPRSGADKSALLLEDPNKFAESITSDVLQAVNHQKAREQGIEKLWNEFYEEQPDLKDVDWHVKSVLGEKLPEWANLPIAEAKKLLAEESRKRIDLLKRKFGTKEEAMKSTEATALPSSGEKAPATPAPESKNLSFTEQLQQMRKKRRA